MTIKDLAALTGYAVGTVSRALNDHPNVSEKARKTILEMMWVWNDYLLPYLVLDITKYRTLPIHIQYLKGSYGTVDLGATMALILLSIIPVIIFYLACQKHIIKGVAAGAVKG